MTDPMFLAALFKSGGAALLLFCIVVVVAIAAAFSSAGAAGGEDATEEYRPEHEVAQWSGVLPSPSLRDDASGYALCKSRNPSWTQ